MNMFPALPLSPEQRKQLSQQLYILLGQQVKSYHKHRRLGDNSSVPTEVAQELLYSIWYTLEGSGGYTPELPMEIQLLRGQELLKQKLEEAKKLCELVAATAPDFQTDFHWDTMAALRLYLERYDLQHFAHRSPEMLDYPLLVSVPDSAKGIDYALFYLNALWQENQILHSFSATALGELYQRCPPGFWEAPQNLCEPPLFNALGRAVLELPPADLQIIECHQQEIIHLCKNVPLDALLKQAASRLRSLLNLTSDISIQAAAAQLKPRLEIALAGNDLTAIFM